MDVVPVVGLELAKSVFRVHASRRAMRGCLSAEVDARSELPPCCADTKIRRSRSLDPPRTSVGL